MGPSQLDALFEPKGIAVFGASNKTDSVGGIVYRNLLAERFDGPIVAINPRHRQVAGRRCHASIAQVKEQTDLAVIATPANTVAPIIQQCGEAGVRHAIILSAGFGETGAAGTQLEQDLKTAADLAGIRFLGPNSVGLVRPWLGVNATFLRSQTPPGSLALVSQSGALCAAISDWAEPNHLGFSALVSLGNATNIGFGDVLEYLATDPKTHAILLYVEGISDARSFLSGLRLAARLKPVIALKAGRHTDSAHAAHTHTGALMGNDDVFDAALERAGVVRARTFGQLFAAAEILSAGKSARGRRLGIITNGGGAGVLAADRAGDLHIDLPPPSASTIATLDAHLPAYWSRANPVDILGDARPEAYRRAIQACMADDAYDGLLVMLTPQAMTDAEEVAKVVAEAGAAADKPLLACWMGQTSVTAARSLLSVSGIPDFATPEAAVEAFSYLARHTLHRRLALETPGPLSASEPPDIEGVRLILRAALGEGRHQLNDIESKAVLRAFRIPCNMTMEADSAAKALVAAETLGFPVAMKINSPQISHKSDVGGVRLNIMNAQDVQATFRDLTANAARRCPDATILGVTVEPMARVDDSRELLVGIARDPVFGPTVLFGAGGTMVELLRDRAVALPPLNEVLARRMIERTRVTRLLDEFRGKQAVDRRAIIDVLLRLSDLVCEFAEIVELDINPLLAGPDGVIAVDARIRIAAAAHTQRYDHMAIVPYPRHLVQHDVLSDGTRLTIRPIRPEDAESERNFVRHLSEQARRFRFAFALKELSPNLLAQFTQIDYGREMALVAFTEEDAGHRQQGVARYIINPDGKSCEFAIVVSDRRQNQGIGTRLMRALMEAARDHGLTTMEGQVAAANKAMLQLMADLAFKIEPSADDPEQRTVTRTL